MKKSYDISCFNFECYLLFPKIVSDSKLYKRHVLKAKQKIIFEMQQYIL
jgi:hypothetical protein